MSDCQCQCGRPLVVYSMLCGGVAPIDCECHRAKDADTDSLLKEIKALRRDLLLLRVRELRQMLATPPKPIV